MEYTKEQLNFINDRGHNILVSAAAGSGKTAVIVERIIRLIVEDGYQVSELLVVTFTRAAASEMKDRIRDAISEKLMSDELTADQREHLTRQMTLIFTADITTIDSFCLNLAREHFNTCHIDPSFRVADEGELRLIAEDVMKELLDGRYESGDEAFYRFADDVSSGRDDSSIEEAIRSVYGFASARPDPEGYIASMMKQYETDTADELEETAFMQELKCIAQDKITLALNILTHALKICDDPAGPYVYADTISGDTELIRGLRDKRSYGELRDALRGLSFSALPRKKDDTIDGELRERVKKLRDRAKKIVRDELAGDLFSKETSDIIYELKMCLPQVKTLAELTLDYMRELSDAKRDRGVVDFSDLEHMALTILRDDETREAIRGRYRELIIDEYQDCNRVQEEIFGAIANGHNYVTVGDVKQSIYSFRDACPELFMDKYERYLTRDGASRLITLSKNFRSSRPVTEAVNSVFEKIMTRSIGGADYDDSQSLHYGELYDKEIPDWKAEYIRVQVDPDGMADAVTTEARAIASRIHELVGDVGIHEAETRQGLSLEDRKEHGSYDCGYGDIVILLRSVRSVSDTFAEVFAKEGIPLVFDSRSGYLLSYEIKEIMNLLTVIDNPRQDIPLAGVMMGFFGGFSPSEMVHVRAKAKDSELYDSLIKTVDMTDGEGSDDDLAVKCRGFIDMLSGYRKKAVYTPIHELVDDIISDFHYDHYVRSLSDGVRREGNLRLLKKRASDYEDTSFHGLFKFLRYIENMKRYEIDFGEASGSARSDAVRIMSIHHSKGLEFPVVFVSNMGRGMNKRDSREAMLFDDELGAGIDLIIRDRNLKIRTLIKKVIARKKNAALINEEMRVLYVAMTRAENKLILTAKKKEGGTVKTDPAEAASLADLLDTAIENADGDISCDITDLPFEGAYEVSGEEVTSEYAPIQRVMELKDNLDGEASAWILGGLNYVYPYEKSLDVPQKVSVSFIKHEAMEEKGVSIASDPRGDRVIPTAGALRGTAVHTAFENLRLDMPSNAENIDRYLDRLVKDKKVSGDERGYIRNKDISDFLSSDICKRMCEAESRKELYREQPFIISVPASEIDRNYPEDDRVMVQGIIDAFFIEKGKVVVVDYKTDSVKDRQVLIDRYQSQLDYYERAIRQLTGITNSEKVIYSVSLSEEILLP